MNSKRMLAIASYINKGDAVIDVGCDHGYLGIILTENNLCRDLLLTDVKQSALNNAKRNIETHDVNIKTMLTDGLENINLNDYNTVTISGMGTSTILKILVLLKNDDNITKIIIQSNNNLDELRVGMQKIGYYLADETTLFENNIWYVIMKFKIGYKALKHSEVLFGLLKKDKKGYYEYLLHNYQKINKLIPKRRIMLSLNIKYKLLILNKLLKECR